MRRAFAGLLPREVLTRHTKALTNFAADLNLQEIAPELLRSQEEFRTEVAGYAKPGALQGMLRNPLDPRHKRDELEQLLTLEIWLRTRSRPSENISQQADAQVVDAT
jgi:hypothetical protein